MNSLLKIKHLIWVQWRGLLLAYVCMLILALSTACLAFLSGPALRFIFNGNMPMLAPWHKAAAFLPPTWLQQMDTIAHQHAVWIVPICMVVAALLKGLAQTGQFYLLGRTSQRILRNIRHDLFQALLQQSPKFYDTCAHGDLLSHITHDTGIVEQALFYGCGSLLRDSLAVTVLLGFCFVSDPVLSLTTFITVPLALLPLGRFARWLKHVSRNNQESQSDIHAVCYEALAGVRVVQAFGQEQQEIKRLEKAGDAYYKSMCVSYFIRAVRTPTMELLGALCIAGLLAYLGAHAQQNDLIDTAHYVSFFAAIVLMYDPLKKLGNVSDYLAAGAAAIDRLYAIIDKKPDIQNKPGATEMHQFETSIVFEQVHFAYHDRQVLCGIDLTITAGHIVAIVGASGAGKSTLAQLLPRFYDVTQGRICIDDKPIDTLSLASLRAQISIVSQETFLFNTSVADNIAYGTHQHASPQDIINAAKAAYADDFIRQLPQGYDTCIGERGITLSGGQKQRIAIARALLRNAPILILDEATSSLDLESERYVQAALQILLQNRTALVIAHRLATIHHAHHIVVLKEGCIIEQGVHASLLAKDGEYAKLYAMQFYQARSAAC